MEATCAQTNKPELRFWGGYGFVNGQRAWMGLLYVNIEYEETYSSQIGHGRFQKNFGLA